ncbi:MAG: hypothetical protein LBS59_01215 [Puniceicoccales bacterium]|jgi:colicin import membrane protein|nr:hypothetical protein [Puniceicoccales bacterium]
MSKSYVIIPVLALGAFGYFYHGFVEEDHARQTTRRLAEKQQRDTKLAAETAARKKALDDALAAQNARKKARETREAAERARADKRAAAIDARDKSFRENEKLTRQKSRLQREIAVEDTALAALAADQKTADSESSFLQKYTAAATQNTAALQALLDKIVALERAAAEYAAAERARAAAAKNKD